MTMCSTKLANQCRKWEKFAVTSLVGIATLAIVMHLEGYTRWDLYTRFVLTTAAVVCSAWCMWVVYSFHGILTWWRELHYHMSEAETTLREAKADIKEIKDLARPS